MKEKLEPQNKFHSTYLLINLLKDEVETGTMEYISQYLFTHKVTARKQLFIISYQWLVLKIRFHYLVEFPTLKNKAILRTNTFFLECLTLLVFLIKIKTKTNKENHQHKPSKPSYFLWDHDCNPSPPE